MDTELIDVSDVLQVQDDDEQATDDDGDAAADPLGCDDAADGQESLEHAGREADDLTQGGGNKPPQQQEEEEKVFYYKCTQCSFQTHQKRQLTQHTESQHGLVVHACSQCSFWSVRSESLGRHVVARHGGLVHRCHQCGYTTSWRTCLAKHVKTAHSSSPPSFNNCDQCDYMTRWKANLKRHKEMKHSDGELPRHQCEQCQYSSPSRLYLKKHVDAVHKHIAYSCEQCSFTTVWKECLQRHVNGMHVSDKTKVYYCDMCDFKTVHNTSLSSHKRIKHKKQIVRCSMCDYESGYRSNLVRHVRKFHPEEVDKWLATKNKHYVELDNAELEAEGKMLNFANVVPEEDSFEKVDKASLEGSFSCAKNLEQNEKTVSEDSVENVKTTETLTLAGRTEPEPVEHFIDMGCLPVKKEDPIELSAPQDVTNEAEGAKLSHTENCLDKDLQKSAKLSEVISNTGNDGSRSTFETSHSQNIQEEGCSSLNKPEPASQNIKIIIPSTDNNPVNQIVFVAFNKAPINKNLSVTNSTQVEQHNNEAFSCSYCDFMCKHKATLKIHVKQSHETLFSCKQCDYSTKHKSNLNRHVRIKHSSVAGMTYSCEQCPFKSMSSEQLRKHQCGVVYSCKHCDLQTTHKENLARHIKATHLGVKYSCELCDYSTGWKSLLSRHVLSRHSETSFFYCDQCEYKTRWKTNLTRHENLMHGSGKKRKYKCSQCKYTATTKVLLKKHMDVTHKRQAHHFSQDSQLTQLDRVGHETMEQVFSLDSVAGPEEESIYEIKREQALSSTLLKSNQTGIDKSSLHEKDMEQNEEFVRESTLENVETMNDLTLSDNTEPEPAEQFIDTERLAVKKEETSKHQTSLQGVTDDRITSIPTETCLDIGLPESVEDKQPEGIENKSKKYELMLETSHQMNNKIDICSTLNESEPPSHSGEKHTIDTNPTECSNTNPVALDEGPVQEDRSEERSQQSKQNKVEAYSCSCCDFTCQQKTYLKAHIEGKHQGVVHNCDHCDFNTQHKCNLKRHIRLKHKCKKGVTYRCEQCPFKTTSEDQMKQHKCGQVYNCSHCDFKTVHNASLWRHMNATHLGVKYNCELCDYSTGLRSLLTSHIMSRHTETDFFYCDQCEYKTRWKANLTRHKKLTHVRSKEGKYKCSQCKYTTTTRLLLKKHLDAMHNRQALCLNQNNQPTQQDNVAGLEEDSFEEIEQDFTNDQLISNQTVTDNSSLHKKNTEQNEELASEIALKNVETMNDITSADNTKTGTIEHFIDTECLAIKIEETINLPTSQYVTNGAENKTLSQTENNMDIKLSGSVKFNQHEVIKNKNTKVETILETSHLMNNQAGICSILKESETASLGEEINPTDPTPTDCSPVSHTNLKSDDEDPLNEDRSVTKSQQQPKQKDVAYSCNYCDFTCQQKAYLKVHIEGKHQGVVYNCDQCDFKSAHKESLTKHIDASHRGVKYYCDVCDYSTGWRNLLQRHVKSQHSQSKGTLHSCDQCDYKTQHKCNLKRHIRIRHKAEEGMTYNCEECPFKTLSEEQFIRHKCGLVFNCKHCDFQTAHKENLGRHMNATHLGVKYSCELCDYSTGWQSLLSRHILSRHSETSFFYCDQCEYKTKWKTNLRRHENLMHDREKKKRKYLNSRLENSMDKNEEFTSEKSLESVKTIDDLSPADNTEPEPLEHFYGTDGLTIKKEDIFEDSLPQDFSCEADQTISSQTENFIDNDLPEYVNVQQETVNNRNDECESILETGVSKNNQEENCTSLIELELTPHGGNDERVIRGSTPVSHTILSKVDETVSHEDRSITKHQLSKQNKDEAYSCNYCDFTCQQKAYLKVHIEGKHQGVVYNCDQCDFKSAHKESLTKHIDASHRGVKYYCNVCDYSTGWRSLLQRHVKSRHSKSKVTLHSCDQCDYKTQHKCNLKRHIRIKHKSKKGLTFSCEQCPFKTLSEEQFRQHKCGQVYNCSHCDFKTAHKVSLSRHMDASHLGVRYNCDHCNYSSGWQNLLRRHILSHHSDTEVTFFHCDQCEYKTRWKTNLKRHDDLMHSTEKKKKHQCGKCTYTASSKVLLKKHVDAAHNGLVYRCQQCRYKTVWPECLHRHVNSVHRSENSVVYACDQCDFKTTQNSSLSSHKRIKHKKVMLQCGMCDFQVGYRSGMVRHVNKRHKQGQADDSLPEAGSADDSLLTSVKTENLLYEDTDTGAIFSHEAELGDEELIDDDSELVDDDSELIDDNSELIDDDSELIDDFKVEME